MIHTHLGPSLYYVSIFLDSFLTHPLCQRMFRSSHLWFLVNFGDKVSKILCKSLFAFCKARWARWKKKENHATKVTDISRTTRQKYGMNETVITVLNGSENCHF